MNRCGNRKTLISSDSNFSASTNSPILFNFTENESVSDSDASYSNCDNDSDFDPKTLYAKKRKTTILTKNERYKELLNALQNSFVLINVIKDKVDGRIKKKKDIPLILFTNGVLRPYQVTGYHWLVSLFENGLSGILGDEMGLGKTIQVIAFVCYLIQFGIPGPFMVICPLTILPNWMYEFNRFVPKIPIIFYHGQKREEMLTDFNINKVQISDDISMDIYPIIITSYEVAMNDLYVFKDVNFKALIVDEGHRLRNSHCRLLRCLKRYHTDMRIILTGTPLQNNLSELWCLFNYLVPEVFYCVDSFKDWFKFKSTQELFQDEVLKEEEERALITTIHKIISPFLLRRLKSEVKIEIPPKKEIVLSIPMTKEQQRIYEKAVQQSLQSLISSRTNIDSANTNDELGARKRGRPRKKSKRNHSQCIVQEINDIVNNFLHKECVKSEPTEIKREPIIEELNEPLTEIHFQNNNIAMLLRKISNHPYMISYPLNRFGNYLLSRELIDISGKMKVLDRLLMKLKKDNHKVLIFSQFNNMLDILQDYLNFKKWKYSRLDGSMNVEDRHDQIIWFNSDTDIFCFLLNTKAGGVGINLSAADTVIIYDSDWNPQNDIQAQDRCHRIGQTTPVLVFKFVTKDSIDQELFDRSEVKRTLEKMVLHDRKFKGDFFVETLDSDDRRDVNDFHFTDYDTETFSFNCMSKEEMIQVLTKKADKRCISLDTIYNTDIDIFLDRSALYKEWSSAGGVSV